MYNRKKYYSIFIVGIMILLIFLYFIQAITYNGNWNFSIDFIITQNQIFNMPFISFGFVLMGLIFVVYIGYLMVRD